jgi:hypothetical protein
MQTAADLALYPTITLTNKRQVQVDENGLIHPRRGRLYPPPRPDEVDAAMRWLATLPSTARLRSATGLGCYAAKHVMEQATGEYTTNGAFLVALFRSGFLLAAHQNDLNADTSLSACFVKKMLDARQCESDD